ncbi:MAG TPA: sensor domain-containing diguanylate cyclase [Thermoanaerobaculia bacterium]|nr:sensor domain-containing diguanylate cyclase [Thermoanaerobaculia bacterium]
MPSRFSRLDDAEALRRFVRDLREGIYVTDGEGRIVDGNPAFLEMLGVASLEEARKKKSADFIVDASRRDAEHLILERDGAVRDFELEIRRGDGELRTVIDTAYRCVDDTTGEVFYQGILIDITDRKRLEDRLFDQSLRDPLTGCWNRRYLAEFATRHADAGGTWGCIMIDLDHFKHYNDEFGHEAGDAVLNRIARFFMRATRAEESTVRMGGDEFLLLLDGAGAQATEMASRRLTIMAERELLAPFSLGWAAREDRESLEKTIARADHRLLRARGLTRSGARPKFVLAPDG